MLKKHELITLLEESLKTEESAIPLYTKHVRSTLFLSDLPVKNKNRIDEILKELNTQSLGHAIMFQQIIDTVKGDDRDVY